MTVAFLSDEWVAELKERLNQDEAFRRASSGAEATLQQVISTPDGERRYWIRVDHGTIDMAPGDAERPDATIVQDRETAAGLARGEVNPVSAFMTGKLKVQGSMMLLMQLQSALGELPRVMAEMDVDY
ncbi:MAG TPA: SCP2 sterol-binding domain-containing protein [Actinomycetota bacterium]|jgi:putative sterol carrier protein|nr:SCP2 sterol-binding domain-containing protein [Actinomycetota bacterium]